MLFKSKQYAFINIFSLSLGLVAGIFILVYALDELSYDQFHANKDRVFRVTTIFENPKTGGQGHNSTNAWPIGKVLADEYPEVESVVYLTNASFLPINYDGERFYENMQFVGADFFQLFSFPLVEGKLASALIEPYQAVISEEMAAKYFPTGSAMGKNLVLGDSISFVVSGIMKNIPENSHFQSDILLSFASYEVLNSYFSYDGGWENISIANYLKLHEGVNQTDFEAKARNLYMEKQADLYASWGSNLLLGFDRLDRIYLHSKAGNPFGPIGSRERVNLVLWICGFVIILACINFINLATARSTERAKEVGLRKVVGSSRHALIFQFLFEALFLSLLAFGLSLILVQVLLPYFNEFLNKSYELHVIYQKPVLIGSSILILAISLLAGFYPAVVLSGFRPVEVLKGRLMSQGKGVYLRKSLITFQFAISLSLVLGTWVVLHQLEYMQNRDLGFQKEEVLILHTNHAPRDKAASIRDELSKIAGVKNVSFSNTVPGRPGWMGQIAYREEYNGEQPVTVEYMAVDEHYLATLDLQVLEGRNFDPNRISDMEEGLILNETAVRAFGWESPEEAIHQRIVSPSTTPQGIVIGVVKDYHQLGLQNPIEGMAMAVAPQYANKFLIRFQKEQTEQVLKEVEATWSAMQEGYEFKYAFLNDDFDRLYKAEKRLARMFSLFAITTILISLVGLLGLVSYLVHVRGREFSIRRVLGAQSNHILFLISREFILLILLGSLVAFPLVYYFGSEWLKNFAFAQHLSWHHYLLALVSAIALTLVLISIQSIKAIQANPVERIKDQ